MFESQRTYETIRRFLLTIVNKDFLVFLVFLALSSTFWLILTLNETYEKDIDVPLQMTNVPKNVVLTTPLEDTVRVTVSDKGYMLMTYMYGDVIRPVILNFGSYANKQTGRGVVPVADFYKHLYTQLYSSSKITSMKPERLEFYFNYGQSKRVPVKLAGRVEPSKSFYLARTAFWPDSVTIYAGKNMIDSIKAAYTEELEIVNLQDTLIREVSLQKLRGVKTVPEKVRIGLYPDVLIDESMEVPIIAVNMPEGRVLRTFPSRVKVHFTCGVRTFRQIRPSQFRVEVDYNELAARPSEKCELHLRTYPHAVLKAWLELTNVDYLIEQQ